MRNSFFQEILVSSVLIILLILVLNPLKFRIPNIVMMTIILIIVVTVFASFIWEENIKDEREAFHRMLAGRIAFLTGTGMLVIAIIVQSLKGNVDFWLVLTLGAMIFAKIIGLIYSRVNH